MKNRFSRGLVAAATVVALSTASLPAASAADNLGDTAAGSAALGAGSAALIGSSVGVGLAVGAVRAIIVTFIYNLLVQNHAIQPAKLPEWIH